MATRDEEAAKDAFNRRDSEASVLAHATGTKQEEDTLAQEAHTKAASFMKPFVFGGLDGIITTFAVVAGASGGRFDIDVILALGLSSLFADALSMGVGDALSSKSEMEAALKEREREEWEFENYRAGEINEMVEIYMEKGLSEEDAESVISTLAKYKDVFIDFMVQDELGLSVPDEDENPWKEGLVTFTAFIVFGFIPLMGYALLLPLNLDVDVLFVIAIVLTAITLFMLGVLKSFFVKRSWIMAGLETLTLGGAVAAVSYLIGWGVESVL